ncbi:MULTISPECIES: TetR/AcrR family transcriptional regulator [Fischerella]|uniref:TetR/AcrR family transcriptional regulator n=1 Tax=Fischerella muscicola CCMEE 5323 TaxID=2019572 RepID=A0A2N6K3C3_FISMU|nr:MULTISPECIES: TetR/AcrR family transcriptional regulator [Fischerella]MBD2432869.1 TetR/AcrR family transcriptional regulator [Fischerella sp. FACHB-380]PLZ89956.1 TetR/AcrR family transcriptional regulator [Fischerella muscicola CCMEE 5323]
MPKIVDHEQYRKQLLMKSFDLFAQKGYAAITMREIAKELGVSTGTLYHYFPNKEALFLQLVEEQTRQDILNFLAEAGDAKNLAERIKALMNFVAKNEDYFSKQALLGFDFYQQQGRDEILNNPTIKKAWEDTKQALADYLEIKDQAIINFIYCFLNGLISSRMFEGDTFSYTEQSELLANMLTAYLQAQPTH